MAFQKFTRSENTEVLSADKHHKVRDALRRLGKVSAKELTDEERIALRKSVDSK